MSKLSNSVLARRQFLKLLGGSAALIPLAGLTGCAGEEPAATAKPKTDTMAKPEPTMAKPAMPKPAPVASGGDMPHLSPDAAQAKALGYVHDASQVNTTAFPRYKAGQICENCLLFQAKGGEEWAGCSIFPGKAVNAKGWCGAYAPKG